jgi:DNA primase
VRQLPGSYILNKFYTYSGAPVHNKYTGIYNASCPVCREGKSFLKKKRLYYYPTTNTFYCFHCSKSWNAFNWIEAVSGMSREEIEAEVLSGNTSLDITDDIKNIKTKKRELPSLPLDSINLCDPLQKQYYGTNVYFQKALEYITERKLNTAINRSSSYFISLTDYFHKNRLCIPYYNRDKKIVFYQTRSLDGSEPRYLNKVGYDKTIFGIDRVDTSLDYLFLFEGPMDAMFVTNGVSVAGLVLTNEQEKQLIEFPFHEKIWVLDNPRFDEAAKDNIYKLVSNKQKVFKWPANKPYKDFNEWCVKENVNSIDYNFILKNLYS